MGTRSVIATLYPDGVKGRYVHWDGYPSGVGRQVYEIAARDGLEGAAFTLIEKHYGWSSVAANASEDDPGHGDGRFAFVPGYGTAYTTVQDQSSPDDWHRPGDEDTWCAYAHVITPKGLVECEIGDGGEWFVLDVVPWGLDTANADFDRIPETAAHPLPFRASDYYPNQKARA